MTSLEFRTRLSEAIRISDAAYNSAVLSPLKMKGPTAYTVGSIPIINDPTRASADTDATHEDTGRQNVGRAEPTIPFIRPDNKVPYTVGASDAQVELAVGSSVATLSQLQKSIEFLNSRVGHVENVLSNRVSPLAAIASQRPYTKGDWFEAMAGEKDPNHTYRSAQEVMWIKNLIHDALDPIRDTLRHHERLLMDVVSTVNAAVGWGQVGRLAMVAGHAQRLGVVSEPQKQQRQQPLKRDNGSNNSRRNSPARRNPEETETVQDEMLQKVDRLRRLASDIRADYLFGEGGGAQTDGVVSSSSGGGSGSNGQNFSTHQPRPHPLGSGESITTPSSNLTTTPSGATSRSHTTTTTTTKTVTTGTTSTPSEEDRGLAFRKLLDVNTSSSGAEDGTRQRHYSSAAQMVRSDMSNPMNDSAHNTSALEAVRNIVSNGVSGDNSLVAGVGGALSAVLVAPSAITRQHSDSQVQPLSQDVSAIEVPYHNKGKLRGGGDYSEDNDEGQTPQGQRSVHFAADQTTFVISNYSAATDTNNSANATTDTTGGAATSRNTIPTTANTTMHMTSLMTIDPTGPNYTVLNTTDNSGIGNYSEINTTARSLVGGLGAALAGVAQNRPSTDSAEHSGAYRQFISSTRQPSGSSYH